MMDTGIHANITRAEYDTIEAVNCSLLKACSRSMAHGKAYLDGFRKESAAMATGSAYHAYVLERSTFDEQYRVLPKMRRAGKAWEEAIEANGGDESRILWQEDVAEFEAMRTALLSESRRRTLTTAPGLYEATIVWTDAETGLLCRGRIDKLIGSLQTAVDLKTTTDAREHSFESDAAKYGYDMQAAFYMDGLRAITGQEHDFAFLAQESEHPFASAMYTVTWGESTHEVGRFKYRALLKAVAESKRSGVWPGYSDHPRELVVPRWAIPHEMKEMYA